MSAHSKGPWSIAVWAAPKKGLVEVVDAHDDTVCMVGTGNLPSVNLDAALIAAAPELLAALDEICEWDAEIGGNNAGMSERIAVARAAIDKARGDL